MDLHEASGRLRRQLPGASAQSERVADRNLSFCGRGIARTLSPEGCGNVRGRTRHGDRHPIRTSAQARAYFEAAVSPIVDAVIPFAAVSGLLRRAATPESCSGKPSARLMPPMILPRANHSGQILPTLHSGTNAPALVFLRRSGCGPDIGSRTVRRVSCHLPIAGFTLPGRHRETAWIATVHDIFPILNLGRILPFVAKDACAKSPRRSIRARLGGLRFQPYQKEFQINRHVSRTGGRSSCCCRGAAFSSAAESRRLPLRGKGTAFRTVHIS